MPCAGLTRLTCLRLDSFNDFGGRSLAAMLPLTDLRSLQLSSITLNDVGLAAALEEAAAEHGDGEARVEQQAAVLLPAVTHLSLRDCHLLRCAFCAGCGWLVPQSPSCRTWSVCCHFSDLASEEGFLPLCCSPAGLVSLAAALPSLRLLEHDGYPIVKPRHLEETLRRCPKLQLLRTSWRPEAVPPQIPPPEGEGEALQGEGQAQMQQQLQQRPLQQHRKAEEHQAFCRKWHHWLQHRQAAEAWVHPHCGACQGSIRVRASHSGLNSLCCFAPTVCAAAWSSSGAPTHKNCSTQRRRWPRQAARPEPTFALPASSAEVGLA
jgi:hypothetical protein